MPDRGDPRGLSRRDFLVASTAAAGAMHVGRPLAGLVQETPVTPTPRRPIVISSANGLPALDKAIAGLRDKGDLLDAVLSVVTHVENDPQDHSVGYGGLPNEDGVVELDACVMHGPTHKAGAVAALRNIRHPSLVARRVMERTDHVLLVGEGALRFAKAHGFKEEDLLTEEAREKWLKWKESLSDKDDWLNTQGQKEDGKPRPGAQGRSETGNGGGIRGADPRERPWGTITCLAVNSAGDLAGSTTTSGLAFKIPGRVGDSPIIGAGLYVDNAVGAAGSTGRGEANLQNCSCFLIVELMRAGRSPQEACLEALRRVADHTEPRLRDRDGRPDFGLTFYALAKDCRHGGAAMWGPAEVSPDVRAGAGTASGAGADAGAESGPDAGAEDKGPRYAVHDGQAAALVPCAILYRR